MIRSNIVVGIQARLSSSRLPCKAMLSIGGTSLLGLLIRRSLACGFDTYLLTSDQAEDNILELEATYAGVTGVIRGPIEDVRARYITLSEKTSSDYLVRVTGDNPFTDFRTIEPLLAHMEVSKTEYLWLDPGCCPDGINLEVFTSQLLHQSVLQSNSPQDLEHVTPWMRQFLIGNGLWLDWYPKISSSYHLGVDLKEDYFKIMMLLGDHMHDEKFLQSPGIVDWVIEQMIASPTYPMFRRHDL